MSTSPVIIVGGGVSGLSTAYYLGRLGIESVLIEKTPRLGGLIKTDVVAGCRLEAGPDSYIATKPAVTELATELGDISQQIISSNDSARRIFIARAGKLIPFPPGMSMMVPGKWVPTLRSELFSPATKRRFLTEQFSRPRERSDDITVGELVNDHFGPELLEYVADPLLVGVYGGDAQNLSAESVLPKFVAFEQRYGSLIKGVRREKSPSRSGLFLSFRDGMQTLTDCLAQRIAGHTKIIHGEVTAVQRNGIWRVEANGIEVSGRQMVLACSAPVCAQLLERSVPGLAADLSTIPYSSSILVTLLYKSSQVNHPLGGFGFLVPQSERRTLAAATWINTKFPARVAGGTIAIRGFIVAEDAKRLSKATDGELAKLTAEDLRRFMGLQAAPEQSVIYRWPQSMPQYVVGHKKRLAAIRKSLLDLSGLHLVGNAYEGVGIPDCVRLGRATAEQISRN